MCNFLLVDESLHRPDEESDPILRKGIPLLKSLKIVNVISIELASHASQKKGSNKPGSLLRNPYKVGGKVIVCVANP